MSPFVRWIALFSLLSALSMPALAQTQASKTQLKEALSEYNAYAKNKNPHVRKAAVEGLYAINHHRIAEIFLACLRDRDPMVRAAAIRGLGFQNTKRTILDLTQILWRGHDLRARLAILQAYKKSRPPYAYSAIQDLCDDRNWQLRAAAIELMGEYPDKDGVGVGTVLPALSDREALVRLAAVRTLARLGNPQANKPIIALLKDKDWRVKAACVAAIEAFRRKSGISALIEVMEREKGRLVDDADAALQRLTGVDFSSDPARWRKWWTLVEPRYRVPTPAELKSKKKRERVTRKGYAISIHDRYPPYHGIKTRSRRMIFVVDTSASMAESITLDAPGTPRYKEHIARYGDDPHRIEIAKRELIEVIAKLPPYVRFNIITFNSTVHRWKKGLVSASGGNKNKAIKFLSRLTPTSLAKTGGRLMGNGKSAGQTNTFEALNACFNITKADDGLKKGYKTEADTVFFLSDGMPTVGRITEPNMLIEYLEAVNRRAQLVIHTISFGNGNQDLMRPLAESSGGQYVCIGN